MRVFMFSVVAIGLMAGVEPVAAQRNAAPPPIKPIVEIDQLAELGRGVASIRYESGNVFRYAEIREDALQTHAGSLSALRWRVHSNALPV